MNKLYEYTEIDEDGTQISYFATRTKCDFKKNARRKKKCKKRLESERYNYIIQVVKRLKLPIDNPAIIIGSLITAKKIIENNNIKEINHYIDLYSNFVKETEQIELPPEEIEVEKDIMKEIAAEKVEGA